MFGFLFKKEKAALLAERAQIIKYREQFDREKLSFDLEKARLGPGIVNMTRQLLKGFNPRLLDPALYDTADTAPSILELEGDEAAQMAFLGQVKDLYTNTALWKITDFLVRNQILYTAKEALNVESSNFGRATINGVSLLRDEIEDLYKIYKERTQPAEEFDPHEAV